MDLSRIEKIYNCNIISTPVSISGSSMIYVCVHEKKEQVSVPLCVSLLCYNTGSPHRGLRKVRLDLKERKHYYKYVM